MNTTTHALVKKRRIMPFFGSSLLVSSLFLGFLVLLPLVMMAKGAYAMGLSAILATLSEPNVLFAIWLSLKMAFFAMLTNVVFGVLVAWVLVRYRFFGRAIMDALVDLPFALPTAVTGIALATLYAPTGLIGHQFDVLGKAIFGSPIQIAYTPIGIWLALVVVSFPFVVRTVQPVLEALPKELEEAATLLGANRWQCFWAVVLPELIPSLLTGAGMAFARATGEYGSVIFIAGNIPMRSEILPVVIMGKLEQFDTNGASAVALAMLCLSVSLIFAINFLTLWYAKRFGS